jgi:hypothetical protein
VRRLVLGQDIAQHRQQIDRAHARVGLGAPDLEPGAGEVKISDAGGAELARGPANMSVATAAYRPDVLSRASALRIAVAPIEVAHTPKSS